MKTKTLMLALGVLALLCAPSPAAASFGVEDFSVSMRNADGTVDELAATQPFVLDVHLAMNADPDGEPEGLLRTIRLDLPAGLVGNALNVPRCSPADFEGAVPSCSGATQVGTIKGIVTGLGQVDAPVYNLEPAAPGHAAAFGATIGGVSMVQRLNLVGTGSSGSIRLFSILPPDPAIVDVDEEIWGVPAAAAHDAERTCQVPGGVVKGCASDAAEKPLLTLPASCDEPMRTTLTATSADPVALPAVATAVSRDAAGNPRPLVGCEAVPFDPDLTVGAGPAALAPTGLSLGLTVPQYEGVGNRAAAKVTEVRFQLPAGIALNPSAGSWLASCAVTTDELPVSCPAGSRIGTVRVRTPLIDHRLEGGVYLAGVDSGGFGSRLGIYLVVEDGTSGTLLKIPGRIEADPAAGRLTATVSELPRFPFSEMEIEFAGGPRAPLTSPSGCGDYTASASFTPSTAPYSSPVDRSARFALSSGPGGSACPAPEVARNPAPSFQAGVVSPAAGRSSPLTVALAREDTDQHFGSFEFTLPPGLVANLGSTPIGAAVGGVEVRAGLGPRPLSLRGTAYLGGPYRGAPYSLTLAVPAEAGPLDLGTIELRAAVDVDPASARVRVSADPLPQILGGVPLEVRSLRIDLDRPGFVRNPTSCEPTAIRGTATSGIGRTAPVSERFQVGGCAALPFRPRLSIALSGSIGRGGHPAVRAVYRGDPAGAAPTGIAFSLPAGELLDLRHLRRLCPRDVAVESCPRGSRLGSVRLETPLLDAPLRGPVYLRVPGRRLPDLSAEVRSGGLRFLLRGRTTDRGGRIGVSLDSLPDVPISKAVLTLPGGRRGIVVNSESLCAAGPASARFSAHSGKQRRLRVPVRLGDAC